MLAVFTEEEQINDFLDKDATIAADNGFHIVIAGCKYKLEEIASKLDSFGIKYQWLNEMYGFHSPVMKPIVKDFQAVAATIQYSLPKIPIVSNVTGKLADDKIASSDYWVQHIIQPVQFADSVNFLEQQNINILIEIGAKPTLLGIAKALLTDKILLPTLNPKWNDWQQILTSLQQLYLQGVKVNWLEIAKTYSGTQISLPHYPFQRKRYWFDLPQKVKVTSYQSNNDNLHPLISKVVASPVKQKLFATQLQSNTVNWLQDHRLENKIVFPGTAYLEMSLAAGRHIYQTSRLTLKNIALKQPLYLLEAKNPLPEIQLVLTPDEKTAQWEIYSADCQEWQLHSSGEVTNLETEVNPPNLVKLQQSFSKEIDVTQHYQLCQQRNIEYGASFQGIKNLWGESGKALGEIQLPNNLIDSQESYLLHPALLDACLQILFTALPPELQTHTYIPVGVKALHLYQSATESVWSYLQLREIKDNSVIADVWLYDRNKNLIATIEGLKSQAISTKSQTNHWLYQPTWQPLSLDSGVTISDKGAWLIVSDSQGVGKELASLLEARQQECYLVKPNLGKNSTSPLTTPNPFSPLLIGEGIKGRGLNKLEDFHLNPKDKKAWESLLQKISQIELPLKGIVYFAEFDNVSKNQPLPEECQTNLYLIQALLKQNLSETPRFYLVTRNSQPAENYQPTISGIRQSCLWGMGKAIALEHPELYYNAIDLSNLVSDKDTLHLYKEITASTNEQVAIRNNRRYVLRLQRYNLTNIPDNQQLQITDKGNLDTLQWQSSTREQPQHNQIEIKVKAMGLNFRDVMIALNLYPDDSQFLGLECAGVVTAIGEGVTNFQIGDEVIAITDHSFSQYVTVDAVLAIPKPDCLTFTEAATIPVTFLTAYYTLVHQGKLQPGEKILIHCAAGGVGLAAIAIAQQIGAEIYVTASPSKWELLQEKGVTCIMNSRTLEFAEEIMTLTKGKGVDVVLNSLSGEYITKSLAVLRDKGRFIEIGKQGIWNRKQIAAVKPNIQYSIVYLWQITQDKPQLIQEMLSQLMPQFAKGKLKPLPHTLFTQKQAIDAFRYMQQGKHQGKIVITQNNQSQEYRGTYLITGGMGAIGLQVAHWLASQGVKNLVLIGRSDVKSELKDSLQKLQDSTQAKIIKADISNTSQLTNIFQQI